MTNGSPMASRVCPAYAAISTVSSRARGPTASSSSDTSPASSGSVRRREAMPSLGGRFGNGGATAVGAELTVRVVGCKRPTAVDAGSLMAAVCVSSAIFSEKMPA